MCFNLLVEKTAAWKRSCLLLKLDLTKAFARLSVPAAIEALQHYGVPAPLLTAVGREMVQAIRVKWEDA